MCFTSYIIFFLVFADSSLEGLGIMMPPAGDVEPSGSWGNLSIYTPHPHRQHPPPSPLRRRPDITPISF